MTLPGIIIILLIIGLITYYYKWKQTAPSSNLPKKLRVPAEYAIPDTPVSFGYKCQWFAVYTTDTKKLADWLGVKDATPCNWKNGIDYAYDDSIFISPPVGGWCLAISKMQLPIAQTEEDAQLLRTMVIDLSKEFSRAQYFGTYRVVGYDCWMKAENGQLERAFASADGANTIVEGEPTPVEQKFNLINTLSEEATNDPDYFDRKDLQWPDESMTMEIAAAWSVNTQNLDERKDIAPGLGLVGVLV
jgi:hypothetical protein